MPGVLEEARVLAALANCTPEIIPPETMRQRKTLQCLAAVSCHHDLPPEITVDIFKGAAETLPVGALAFASSSLLQSVDMGRCNLEDAAALLGPSRETVQRLESPSHIRKAIWYWGIGKPQSPTWWIRAIGKSQAHRMITSAVDSHETYARMFPFISDSPSDIAHIDPNLVSTALEACLDILDRRQRPIAADRPFDHVVAAAIALAQKMLDAYALYQNWWLFPTRAALKLVKYWKQAHEALVAWLDSSPDMAWLVVCALPWNDIPRDIRRIILRGQDDKGVCQTIRAARTNGAPFSTTAPSAFWCALSRRTWLRLSYQRRREWIGTLASLNFKAFHAVERLFQTIGPDVWTIAHIDPQYWWAVSKGLRACGTPVQPIRELVFPLVCANLDDAARHRLLHRIPENAYNHEVFAQICSGITPDIVRQHPKEWPHIRRVIHHAPTYGVTTLRVLLADSAAREAFLTSFQVPIAEYARAVLIKRCFALPVWNDAYSHEDIAEMFEKAKADSIALLWLALKTIIRDDGLPVEFNSIAFNTHEQKIRAYSIILFFSWAYGGMPFFQPNIIMQCGEVLDNLLRYFGQDEQINDLPTILNVLCHFIPLPQFLSLFWTLLTLYRESNRRGDVILELKKIIEANKGPLHPIIAPYFRSDTSSPAELPNSHDSSFR